ncbi:alpha/beta hydrolase fold-domain-containing protein [Leucosporidium creatinivorum]|uniref:Alpha/beta hydrolase fold-domain-containing protein n=1 Tax=Leucosporidium creatinivorum TaxID=106004 RepID=A0A1Y2FWJ4_9BASI|nr:alpha/beta hydrolase fold-domain-containing protein [Leucosporidium creatinivorum]
MHTFKKAALLIPVALFDLQGGLYNVYNPSKPYPFAQPATLYYLFVALHLLSTLLPLPVWTLLYALRIKRRPRPSWSSTQCFVWRRRRNDSVEQLAKGFVGIYAQGGSYLHFSAHESSATSAIPCHLMKLGCFDSIYSVEYPLLPAPFPAALQDIAAVFVRLIQLGIPADRIILTGDSTRGNIILALARWIRDEGLLRQPAGVLLLPPWCDPSHSFRTSSKCFNPHPHPSDYLTDHPPAYRHNVQSFLGGHRPQSFLRHPYISPPASPVPDGSFKSIPPVFVQYGDAERLEESIVQLVAALRQVEVSA